MSDVRSRLALTVCESVSLAMILLRRGTASAASSALQARCGFALPQPGRLTSASATQVLWSGPDRFLAVRDDPRTGLAAELTAALGDLAHVVEASSSRTVFEVAGSGAAEALNRVLPIDLHPRAFPAGSVALTSAAHMAVQLWRPGDDAVFRLACSSSFAASLRHHLAAAGFGD
ncbi:MAG TPA: sarcosine oxidase subunit gamma family protein [Acetobacteraceae bacterium]|nr:sarcosine oxidase subunit gamma family protein [Acetobacteraceae bacterium]